MQTRQWRASWDGALIEVKYRAVPFSGMEPSLGVYPTAEILIDGVSVAHRAWGQHSEMAFEGAIQRPNGAATPFSIRVDHMPDRLGCEIRVDDKTVDVL